MRNIDLAKRETNLQERRFFSRKEFTLPASGQFQVAFFDENGRFPNVQGNIGSANKIVNGSFTLEGIGFAAFIRDGGANQNQPQAVVPLASVSIYNSLVNNSAIRISESNKTIYEAALIEFIKPVQNAATGGTPLQDTNIVSHEQTYGKLRLNVPYFFRQEQTFAFELIGANLSTNTGAFILIAEMLGRYEFNPGYGAA